MQQMLEVTHMARKSCLLKFQEFCELVVKQPSSKIKLYKQISYIKKETVNTQNSSLPSLLHFTINHALESINNIHFSCMVEITYNDVLLYISSQSV